MTRRVTVAASAWRMVGRYWLLLVAVVCLGLYSYAFLERTVYQTYESWAFDRTEERRGAVAVSFTDPLMPRDGVVSPRKLVPVSRSLSPVGAIGRLSIPRLHLSAMVREGIDTHTLQLAVGHIPSTALPGQSGNVGVAGHRDTFFRGLKDLRTGDEIQFTTLSGDFIYVVESLVLVEPDNVGVLAPSSENVLTLVTCYPFSYIGNAPMRFVARARQVSPESAPPSTVE